MMIRAEHRFQLPAPPSQAFELLSDPNRDPEWQGACLETQVHGDAPGAGCTYDITFNMVGKRLVFTVEITEYEPGRLSRFEVREGPFRYIGSYTYSAREDGTTDVHWTFDVDPGDYFGIMPKSLLKKILVTQVKKDTSTLAKRLATAAPTH